MQAIQNGDRPTRAVADRWGVSVGTATQKIRDTRTRGLLSPHPRPGVAGGHLTDKAISLLQARQKEG